MKTFEEVLREQAHKTHTRFFRARALNKILDARPSPRRTRILQRLENQTIAYLQGRDVALAPAAAPGSVDWDQIDWARLFDVILKFLLLILPLFITTGPGEAKPKPKAKADKADKSEK